MPNSNKNLTERNQSVASAPKPDYFMCATMPNDALIEVGRRLGVASLLTGQFHPILQVFAQEHANYQAEVGKQGHQGWNERVRKLRELVTDCGSFSEVANESWPDQKLADASIEMYASWKQSPGHWSAINSSQHYWGAAMAYREENRVWYACMIFAHKRTA